MKPWEKYKAEAPQEGAPWERYKKAAQEGPWNQYADAAINKLEGRGDNPTSSASGVGQFIDSTWINTIKKHKPELVEGKTREEIVALKRDPLLGSQMLSFHRQDNAELITKAGLPVNTYNLYAYHHFGPGGGSKFAKAADNTPIEAVLTPEQIDANAYLKGKSVGEVKTNWSERLQPKGPWTKHRGK